MVFLVFAFLQLLDALTTAIFLRLGAPEANPITNYFLNWGAKHGHSSLCVLLVYKLVAVVLAYDLWLEFVSRRPIFVKVNYLFAGVAIWNLVAIMRILGIF